MISPEEKEIRTQKLVTLLRQISDEEDIADSELVYKNYYEKFCEVYKDGYRQPYDVIYNLLMEMKWSGKEVDKLCYNIQFMYQYAYQRIKDNRSDLENVYRQIEKLYCHINLDIARMNYVTASEFVKGQKAKDFESQIKRLDNSIISFDKRMKNTQKNVYTRIKKEISKIQTESMTILSIFTAVVLAFVGGLVFSSSVLENIHKTSIYRTSFMAIIIGIVVVNSIWGLVSLLEKTNVNKKIHKSPFFIADIMLGVIFFVMVVACYNDSFKIENNINEKLQVIDADNVKAIKELVKDINEGRTDDEDDNIKPTSKPKSYNKEEKK